MKNLLQVTFLLFVSTDIFVALGSQAAARNGKFVINDSGVQGGGTFSLTNGTAEVELRLLIGNEASKAVEQTGNSSATNPANASVNETRMDLENVNESIGRYENSREDGSSFATNANGRQPSVAERIMNGQKSEKEKVTNEKPSGENSESPILPSAGGGPVGSHVRIVAVDDQYPIKGMQFSDEDIKFMDEALDTHNRFRSIHNAPPMILNRDMSEDAKRFAEKLAKESALEHSPKNTRPSEGENLAMGCATDEPPITASAAVKKWYDEVCKYNFANAAFQKPAGHFSQVVWKPSLELGVGKADGSKWGMKCSFIVARYRVKGNVDTGNNDFAKNVNKGSFDPAYCNVIDKEETRDNKSDPTAASPSVGEMRNYPEYTGYNEGIYGYGRHAQFRGKIPRPGKGSHEHAVHHGRPGKERSQKLTRFQVL